MYIYWYSCLQLEWVAITLVKMYARKKEVIWQRMCYVFVINSGIYSVYYHYEKFDHNQLHFYYHTSSPWCSTCYKCRQLYLKTSFALTYQYYFHVPVDSSLWKKWKKRGYVQWFIITSVQTGFSKQIQFVWWSTSCSTPNLHILFFFFFSWLIRSNEWSQKKNIH